MKCPSVGTQAVFQARTLINTEFIRGNVDDMTRIAATDPATSKDRG
jgi:hypothetical protein